MVKAICEIYLNKEATKRVVARYPWVFADQITNPSTLATSSNAELAHLHSPKGEFLGTALIDKNSKLALRVIDSQKIALIDLDFFINRFGTAKLKRDKFTDAPYYRLINYEGDGLGGLCIDRFGPHFIIDASLEFYFLHKDLIACALRTLFNAGSVSMNYAGHQYLLHGDTNLAFLIEEDGLSFHVDAQCGQKTGWYYDQRENRRLVRELAKDARVLDCFCYSGGFGLYALAGQAKHVTFIDSSKSALLLAEQNAICNGFSSSLYKIWLGDAEARMDELSEQNAQFDLIILDPPPLIKNKQSKLAAVKKYQRIASMGLRLLKAGGLMLYSSCSHHMHKSDLRKMLIRAASRAECTVEIIKEIGHPFDHPTCKNLPESVYLNTILLRRDV